MTHHTRIVTLGLVLVFAAAGNVAVAGDLDPPAGPVAPTMKPLSEIEPRIALSATNTPGDADSVFRITQPGSYYLTASVPTGFQKHGIEIAISRVTLDLNGFLAAGANLGAFDGVTASGALTNIEVLNGIVADSGDKGLDLSTSTNCRVRGVQAKGNGAGGIAVGSGGMVVDCSAWSNGSVGITVGEGSTLSGCVAGANAFGISAGAGSTLTECVARQNTLNGVSTGTDCTIAHCSATNNGSVGINASTGCAVFGCTASLNGSPGIIVSSGALVARCTAYGNSGDGITATTVSAIIDCTARANALDGIRVGSRCVVRENTCGENGQDVATGAGIHATGSDNRVEGNNCTLADRGVDVDAAGNIMVRNTCSGNTLNWDVVAGNVILVVNATTAAAVSGNSGGTAPGSTDPNANFTY